MPAARTLTLLLSPLLACAHAAAPAPPAAPEPSAAAAPAAEAASPSLAVTLRPRDDKAPELEVELVARALSGARWELPALSGLEVVGLVARDDAGDVPFQQGREGPVLRVTFARAPRGPLRLRYVVRPTWEEGVIADVPAPLVLRLGRDHLLASAEQALLLPEGPGEALVALTLRADAAPGRRIASTLGVDATQRARLADLRHAALLVGPLGRATFRGPDGEDDFAWTGETRFDMRWSVAETAGVRTAVDLYFGAEPTETARFTALFAVDIDFPAGEGAIVTPRGGGLYVALSPGAQWRAPVRLAVAQGLVHRWLGGRLRLRGPAAAPEAGAWFSEGVARFVAREVLWSLGTLSTVDYAEEINAQWAELVTAPLRRASAAELAAAAAAGDAAAAAVLRARGVLAATRLEAELRARGRSLKDLLRELVALARKDNLRELPPAALFDRVARELGEGERAALQATLAGSALPTLPPAALGECFARAPQTYLGRDLGFDAAASQTTGKLVGLRPEGPAARAGLRADEPLISLVITGDDPTDPVEVTVDRGGQAQTITFRPIGASGRAEAWKRRPGARDETCPR